MSTEEPDARFWQQLTGSNLDADGDREKFCSVCSRRITVGTDGTEYGHERETSYSGQGERCPRRPDSVDPSRSGPDHDGWVSAGGFP